MEERSDVDEFAEAVFKAPLEPLTDREIAALYGPDVRSLGKLIGRTIARQRAADLVVSCVRGAGNAALRIVDCVGDVVANFVNNLAPSLPEPAYATRGMGAKPIAGRAVAGRIEATKKGDGARLNINIADVAGRCDVRIRLENISGGGTLAPLELYIEDREDGKVLLKKTSYASGEAILRGVEPGEYWIEAECGDKSAEMALKVEGAER